MSGFTDLFSVNTVVGVVDYVIGWYEYLAGVPSDDGDDSDSWEEWGQFVIIDEEKI